MPSLCAARLHRLGCSSHRRSAARSITLRCASSRCSALPSAPCFRLRHGSCCAPAQRSSCTSRHRVERHRSALRAITLRWPSLWTARHGSALLCAVPIASHEHAHAPSAMVLRCAPSLCAARHRSAPPPGLPLARCRSALHSHCSALYYAPVIASASSTIILCDLRRPASRAIGLHCAPTLCAASPRSSCSSRRCSAPSTPPLCAAYHRPALRAIGSRCAPQIRLCQVPPLCDAHHHSALRAIGLRCTPSIRAYASSLCTARHRSAMCTIPCRLRPIGLLYAARHRFAPCASDRAAPSGIVQRCASSFCAVRRRAALRAIASPCAPPIGLRCTPRSLRRVQSFYSDRHRPVRIGLRFTLSLAPTLFAARHRSSRSCRRRSAARAFGLRCASLFALRRAPHRPALRAIGLHRAPSLHAMPRWSGCASSLRTAGHRSALCATDRITASRLVPSISTAHLRSALPSLCADRPALRAVALRYVHRSALGSTGRHQHASPPRASHHRSAPATTVAPR
jgi:hypothetical protein